MALVYSGAEMISIKLTPLVWGSNLAQKVHADLKGNVYLARSRNNL